MIFTSKCGHGKSRPPFSRRPGIKRAGNLFQDFLLGGAAGGWRLFSFESSGQGGPMMVRLANLDFSVDYCFSFFKKQTAITPTSNGKITLP